MASGDMSATAVPLEDLRQPIFVLLGVRALPQAAAVSRAWAAAGRDETLWWAWLQQFWDIDDLEGVAPGFSSAREVLQMACATAAWTKRAVPGELIPAIDDPRFITAWGDFCPEVQAFLFGISSGAMPTHDGLFTFHCRGATPVHYRHCGDPEGAEKATLAGRQLTGGTWKWSPDKVEWYPTTSQDITRGRFGNGSWRLVYQNRLIVEILQQFPLVPFFRKAYRCSDAALTLAPLFNDGQLSNFRRNVEFISSPTPVLPAPTTPCVQSGAFTAHLLFLPALQLTCCETGWQISSHTLDRLPPGSVTFGEFVKGLDQHHFPEWARGTPMAAHFFMYCQQVLAVMRRPRDPQQEQLDW